MWKCVILSRQRRIGEPSDDAMEIYLTELDNESPRLVRLIMKSVSNDKRRIRHIGCKRFGIRCSTQRAVHP